MISDKKDRGRPSISASGKEEMVSKIIPFLRAGLSIRKSVTEAGISRATLYRVMNSDKDFMDKITHSRNYLSILVSNALVKELFAIVEKQNGNEGKHTEPQSLSKEDTKFLFRFVLKTRFCRDEWGRLKNADSFDPEAEIQRVKQVLHN